MQAIAFIDVKIEVVFFHFPVFEQATIKAVFLL